VAQSTSPGQPCSALLPCSKEPQQNCLQFFTKLLPQVLSVQCQEQSNTLLRVYQWAFSSLPVVSAVVMVVLLPVVVVVGAEEGKRRDMVAMLSVVWKETLVAQLCVQEHLGFNKEDINVG